MMSVIDEIKDELQERLKYLTDNNQLVEAQRLEQRTRFDLEMIQELGYCSGIETIAVSVWAWPWRSAADLI